MMDVADYRLRLAIVFELKTLGVKPGRLSKAELRLENEAASMQPIDETQTFGLPLKCLAPRMAVEVDGVTVPTLVHAIGTAVRENITAKGLFRVNGSAVRMRTLQQDVDGGKPPHGSVHDQTGLLKMFLRALPDPLFTYRFYTDFIAAFKLQDEEARKKAVLMLCLLLPTEHLYTLTYLMRLLHEVAQEEENQMSASSLASILTPNLLRPPVERTATTSERELANHASCVGVVEMLIDHAAEIGGVPVDVVRNAQDMANPEKARKLYETQINGRTKWWSRGYRPRRNRNTGAVSMQTLNLLKRSEKMIKEQHTPTIARKRLGSNAAAASPVQYSQVLNGASAHEANRSPLSQGDGGAAAAAAVG